MDDFSKTDLRELHRCLKYMTSSGVTPYSCHTIALTKKVREMIEKYCDHEWNTLELMKKIVLNPGEAFPVECIKCGVGYRC